MLRDVSIDVNSLTMLMKWKALEVPGCINNANRRLRSHPSITAECHCVKSKTHLLVAEIWARHSAETTAAFSNFRASAPVRANAPPDLDAWIALRILRNTHSQHIPRHESVIRDGRHIQDQTI